MMMTIEERKAFQQFANYVYNNMLPINDNMYSTEVLETFHALVYAVDPTCLLLYGDSLVEVFL